MRKYLFKLLAVILSLALITTCGVTAIGCGDSGEGTGPIINTIPEDEGTIRLNAQSMNLIVGDYASISADTNNLKGWKVFYQSSSPNVVTVDADGNLEAISEGKAEITATYTNNKKQVTDKCTINVSFGDYIPEIQIAEGYDFSETLNMTANGQFAITPVIKFNNRIFYDAEFDYSVNGGVSIENGLIKAGNEEGTATITIKALKWKGKEFGVYSMTETINVNITSIVSFTMNGGSLSNVNLYTVDSFDGKEYPTISNFDVSVNDNGTITNNFDVKVANENVVTYNSSTKVVSTKAFGQTTITITYKKGNSVYAESVNVQVIRPIKEIEEVIQKFDIGKGMYVDANKNLRYLNEFVGETDFEMYDASENGNKLTVQNNKVLGVSPISDVAPITSIRFGDKKVEYQVTVKNYTHIILDANDLQNFALDDDYITGGHWLIDNNIDATGVEIKHTKLASYNALNMAFSGILDAQGHTIFNLDARKTVANNGDGVGLFGVIAGGAIIKNLGLSNLIADNVYYFASRIDSNATLENVYVGLADTGVSTRGFLRHMGVSILFKEVVVEGAGWQTRTAKYSNSDPLTGVLSSYAFNEVSVDSQNFYVIHPNMLQSGFANRSPNDKNGICNVCGNIYDGSNKAFADLKVDWCSCGATRAQSENYIIEQLEAHRYASNETVANTNLYKLDNGIVKPLIPGDESIVKAGKAGLLNENGEIEYIPASRFANVQLTKINGVKRYNNRVAMSADKFNNIGSFNLNLFDERYWVIENNVPVFKTADASIFPLVNGVNVSNSESYKVSKVGNEYEISFENRLGSKAEIKSIESSNVDYIQVVEGTNKVKLLKSANPSEKVKVEITVEFVNFSGSIQQKVLTFVVDKEEYIVDEEIEYSSEDGIISLYSLGLEDMEYSITSAQQITVEENDGVPTEVVEDLTVANNRITDAIISIKEDLSGVNNIKLRVYFGDSSYLFNNVKAYSKIITNIDEFKEAFEIDANFKGNGYYVLKNDIDANGAVLNHSALLSETSGAFTGIFDGQGYTIYNLDATNKSDFAPNKRGIKSLGIFGWFSGAVVRNVAFVNLKASNSYYIAGGVTDELTSFNNVYIKLENTGVLPYGMIGKEFGPRQFTMSNTVIECEYNETFDNDFYFQAQKSILSGWSGIINSGSNNYFITPNSLGSNLYSYNTYTIFEGHMLAENDEYFPTALVYEDGSKVKWSDIVDGVDNPFNNGKLGRMVDGVWVQDDRYVGLSFNKPSSRLSPNVRRYDNREAMAQDYENNKGNNPIFNVDEMDATCWTIVDGVPTWKNLQQ